MPNTFEAYSYGLESPAQFAAAVTPDNDNDLATAARALLIGVAGDVKVTTTGGSTVTMTVPAGILPVSVVRVFATGTDATDIVALW